MAPIAAGSQPVAMAQQFTHEDRTRFLSLFRASGRSQREFAAQHGISLGTLRGWLYRPAKTTALEARFVKVVSTSRVAPTSRAASVRDAHIEIQLGQVHIVLPTTTCAEYIATIAQVLAASEHSR